MGLIWSSLDECSDQKQREVFVVAGYLASQGEWTDIEGHWVRRLERECDPAPMKYFSATECKSLRGEFLRFRDKHKFPHPTGRDAANAVRDDLQLILRSSLTRGFGLGINLRDYRSVRRSSRARKVLHANPYDNGYLTMFIQIAGACDDEMPLKVKTETLAFLCDEHNRSSNVKAVYDNLKKHNPRCGAWMGSLSYADNKKSPALQAADLLASRCKDFLIEYLDDTRQETHKQFVMRWKTVLGRNVGIRCMNKESLKGVVDANVPKEGKFNIYSTQQLALFADLTKSNEKKLGTR